MKEYGGYIELDTYHGKLFHEDGIALNCGRNGLAYIIKTRKIKKIAIPYFLCNSVNSTCLREGVTVQYYHIGTDFKPKGINLDKDEWLYIVNYYGQLDRTYMLQLVEQYERVIIDQAQAYFDLPIDGADAIYTCRKFFGVPDGAFVYTKKDFSNNYPIDESFDRMHFLLGRFERTASEFYSEYTGNNRMFSNEPIKYMSRLTENLLRGIDYEFCKERRTENFQYLHDAFKNINILRLDIPIGAFMYPLYLDSGSEIRKELQKKKIYIPTLWPDVFDICDDSVPEYDMVKNILPLPVDQRYGKADMEYLIQEVLKCLKF